MPGVVVPAMREKKDPLESIMRGLQIATQVYGLKQASDEADAKEEKRLQEQGERAQQVADRQDKERGVISPLQAATMTSPKGGMKQVPEGTPGAVRMFVRGEGGKESPLWLAAQEKRAEGPLTKEVGGQLVQYNPETKKWDKVFSAPKEGGGGSWSSSGQVDESGHLLLVNNKTGEVKPGQKVGKKPGSVASMSPEEKAAAAIATNFESDFAKKTQIAQVIDREREKFDEFVKKGDVDGAVRHGEGMLKALNSAFGPDAVGVEESKRLGGYLQPFKAPWEPGSMIGRDLDLFSAQIKAKSDALRAAAQDSIGQAEKIRGGGLKAAGNATPTDSKIIGDKTSQPDGTALANPSDVPPGVALDDIEAELRRRGALPDVADRPQDTGRRTGGR